MRKISFAYLCVLLACFSLRAQDVSFGNVLIHHDPCLMGGNALVAGSAAWNTLTALESKTTGNVSLGYLGWAPASAVATDNAYGSASCKIGSSMAVSIGASNAWGLSYEEYSFEGLKIGDYVPRDFSLEAGLALKVVDWLSVGAKIHYLKSSFASDYSISTRLWDVMASSRLGSLRAVLGVCALGAKDAPSCVVAGAGYELAFGSCVLDTYAQGDYYLYGGGRVGVGADFCWNEMLSLRAGYNLSFDAPMDSYLSVGVGAGYGAVKFNASYLVASGPINGTMVFGLGLGF